MTMPNTTKEAAINFELLPEQARNPEFLAYVIAGTLYTRGELSEKLAQEAVGEPSRRAFQLKMVEYGFPMLIDTEENIQAELNA